MMRKGLGIGGVPTGPPGGPERGADGEVELRRMAGGASRRHYGGLRRTVATEASSHNLDYPKPPAFAAQTQKAPRERGFKGSWVRGQDLNL